MNTIPLYGQITLCSSTHHLGVSISWLLWIMQPRTEVYKYLFESLLSILLGPYLGEGNSTPLQYSCLENPRDGGAWWAAVSGVGQSRTRLKWLSSSRYISRRERWIIWSFYVYFFKRPPHCFPHQLYHFTFLPTMHRVLISLCPHPQPLFFCFNNIYCAVQC